MELVALSSYRIALFGTPFPSDGTALSDCWDCGTDRTPQQNPLCLSFATAVQKRCIGPIRTHDNPGTLESILIYPHQSHDPLGNADCHDVAGLFALDRPPQSCIVHRTGGAALQFRFRVIKPQSICRFTDLAFINIRQNPVRLSFENQTGFFTPPESFSQ